MRKGENCNIRGWSNSFPDKKTQGRIEVKSQVTRAGVGRRWRMQATNIRGFEILDPSPWLPFFARLLVSYRSRHYKKPRFIKFII